MALAARHWSLKQYIRAWVRVHRHLRDLSQDMFEEGDPRLFNLLSEHGLEITMIERYERR